MPGGEERPRPLPQDLARSEQGLSEQGLGVGEESGAPPTPGTRNDSQGGVL